MKYSVKEIYYTLQGEGAHTGRAAVFLRFSDCNLWTGHESDRSSAVCQFCDTDFVGVDGPNGGRFDAAELAAAARRQWPSPPTGKPFIVCTGGEPLLQLDPPAIEALHEVGFEVAIETNGTLAVPTGIDWICVSPKAGAKLRVRNGNELKLVYPQAGLLPEDVDSLDFEHFFLQPMDGPDQDVNIRKTVRYCLEHPQWRLSLQTHKFIGID